MKRRELLAYLTGAGAGLGSWRAIDNTMLGYGVAVGTNLTEQDLSQYVTGRLAKAGVDAPADVEVEPMTVAQFFETVDRSAVRPDIIAAMRPNDPEPVSPSILRQFIEDDPADTEAVAYGLADGFRKHATYDIPRYMAGAVEDNILLGHVELRSYFENEHTIEAMVAGTTPGMFCTEFTIQSIRAFHAVAPGTQSIPVVAGYVGDDRHKHAYTALLTVTKGAGTLRCPMTFLDYMHATLYEDLRLRGILGTGLNGYDTRHRATELHWDL